MDVAALRAFPLGLAWLEYSVAIRDNELSIRCSAHSVSGA